MAAQLPHDPQTLEELLASLPEEERIILTLHYLRAMTESQIAALLGVPERAVAVVITTGKSRLLSALNRLL
jgi:RNA polymerase sigma factor (sigma-70 family)